MDALTVLIVDDNSAHSEGLTELMKIKGIIALHAATGSDAVRVASTHPVDAVLLDVHLPDMTGYNVCRQLRSDPAMEKVAIIFHTGTAWFPEEGHGGDAFLTYPIIFSDLLAVIEGCVCKRKGKAVSGVGNPMQNAHYAANRSVFP